MPSSSIALVNLLKKPAATHPPVSNHHGNAPSRRRSSARAKVSIPADQKKIDSASMVINSEPAWKIGVRLTSATVHRPAAAP